MIVIADRFWPTCIGIYIMSFLARIFNNAPAPVEPLQKAQAPFAVSSGTDIVAPDNSPMGDYTNDPMEQKRQELDALWRAYQKSPWVRKCVKAIATAITKRWEIVPRNPEEEADPDKVMRVEAFLNNLYADPTLPETPEAFFRKIVIALLVFGHVACEFRTSSGKSELVANIKKSLADKFDLNKAYQQLGFGPMMLPNYEQEVEDAAAILPEDGTPAYLRILPTQSIEIVQDSKGNIKQYNQWTTKGKKIVFQPQEIFHVVHPDSFDFSYGESQIEGLALLATIDRLIDDRQKGVLSGDSAIDTLFTVTDATPENIKRLSQELVTKYRGAGAALRFIVAPEGVKSQDLSKSKDGDFLKLKEWIRDEIALCLGVPLSVLGESSGSSMNGAGSDTHLRNFIENTCRPIAVHIEAAFNRAIMARFQREGIDYILKLVLEDADDLSEVITANNTAIFSAQMTPNEARQRLNLPAEEGGDVLVMGSKQPVLLTDVAAGMTRPPQAQPVQPNGMTGEQNAAVQKAQAALRELRKSF